MACQDVGSTTDTEVPCSMACQDVGSERIEEGESNILPCGGCNQLVNSSHRTVFLGAHDGCGRRRESGENGHSSQGPRNNSSVSQEAISDRHSTAGNKGSYTHMHIDVYVRTIRHKAE